MKQSQQGVTLVVALLFLLILTIISVFAATNATLELKMAGNMQDDFISFNSAEAGVAAVLAIEEAFVGRDVAEPFDLLPDDEPNPLLALRDGSESVDIDITLTSPATECPRNVAGFSAGVLNCEFYRVRAQHFVQAKGNTEVNQGVVKTIIKQ
jgi:type IV pilus assembly protein PilX